MISPFLVVMLKMEENLDSTDLPSSRTKRLSHNTVYREKSKLLGASV